MDTEVQESSTLTNRTSEFVTQYYPWTKPTLLFSGPVNSFLSWNLFQPLAKLSYNVYLLHGIVQLYRIGNLRTNINAGDLDIVSFKFNPKFKRISFLTFFQTYEFLGDLTVSYLLAIPFALLFEMPFGNIDRYLFQNVKILPLPTQIKNRFKNKA